MNSKKTSSSSLTLVLGLLLVNLLGCGGSGGSGESVITPPVSSAVIFQDDFESTDAVGSRYFEYDSSDERFVRMPGVGVNGSYGMQAHWNTGDVGAGNLKRSFGRVPAGLGYASQSNQDTDFNEIYWRLYLRNEPGWSGYPNKLTRATIFGSESSWANAILANVWSSDSEPVIVLDPASGIDESNSLVTTSYNDFANLRWLGATPGSAPVFAAETAGHWFCIEAHVKLNTPGESDGIFELWVDGSLDSQETGLNWRGTWQNYGINAVFFENYWNDGAPGERTRYLDNLVISTERIGCIENVQD